MIAREHTGLLETEERERLERDFAQGEQVDNPNVIACTSTLEMGIDIGDLSSTMLCSIPPNTAGYLQRIGRAGRATGTALIVSLINQRPHDLFFYGRPIEMLRGKIDPPGCWLDASAVLVRQYLAFCLDSATAGEVLTSLPSTARQMIDDFANPAGQLRRTLDWIEAHETELRTTFLHRFRDDIQADTGERFLRDTSTELLRHQIAMAIEEIDRTLRDLDNARRRLREQHDRLEKDENEAREEIARELRVLRSRQLSLSRMPSLEILTDRGLLPNYAFPEEGIPFNGTVYNRHRHSRRRPERQASHESGGDDDRHGGPDQQTIDIRRPAATGLRELAPANHFYTHGRVFDIQQIALGNAQNPLVETWAICGACGHMRRETDLLANPQATACPQCGHDDVSNSQIDIGQRRPFLLFSRSTAFSHMEHYESLSADRSEERESQRYHHVVSFDLTGEAARGAVGEDTLPFGIEYRADVTLREINTGYQNLAPVVPFGVDQRATDDGFRVCADCGIIEPPTTSPAGRDKVIHRRSCIARRRIEKRLQEGRAATEYNWKSLYLYRELRSEAIRLLLPIADNSDIATLSAAIMLGLRLRFEGDPEHLLVQPHALPDPAKGLNRYYLIVMDTVPGGTGYLKSLYQEKDARGREGEGMLHALRLARAALENCPCRQVQTSLDRADSDGCYRCIRNWRQQHEAGRISRERAIVLLGQLITAGDNRAPRESLDDIRINSLWQSLLEKRFIDTLHYFVDAEHGNWEQTVIRGRAGYRFNPASHPDRFWELEPQPTLGPKDGVAIPCRPDFLLRADDESLPPIAIFTDGFQFHCHPHNRIADDLQKRRAIIESRRYLVWSITWDDLDGAMPGLSLFPEMMTAPLKVYANARRKSDPQLPDPEAVTRASFAQLAEFIKTPRREVWTEFAHIIGINPLYLLAQQQRTLDTGSLRAALNTWQQGGPLAPLPATTGAAWVVSDRLTLEQDIAACIPTSEVLSRRPTSIIFLGRLDDRNDECSSPDYSTRWRRFLGCLNLLQFANNFHFHATSEIDAGTAPDLLLHTPAGIPAAWQPILDAVAPSLEPLVRQLASSGAALPQTEYFLDDFAEESFAELAWPTASPPLAILAGEQATLAAEWQRRGWSIATIDTPSSELIDLVGKA